MRIIPPDQPADIPDASQDTSTESVSVPNEIQQAHTSASEDSSALPLLIGDEFKHLYALLKNYARLLVHSNNLTDYLHGFFATKSQMLNRKHGSMCKSEFIPYAKTALKYYIFDQLRKETKKKALFVPLKPLHDDLSELCKAGPFSKDHEAHLHQLIKQEIDKLPPVERKLVLSHYFHDPPISIKILSSRFDLSESHIRVHLFRARKRLKKLCEKHSSLYHDLG